MMLVNMRLKIDFDVRQICQEFTKVRHICLSRANLPDNHHICLKSYQNPADLAGVRQIWWCQADLPENDQNAAHLVVVRQIWCSPSTCSETLVSQIICPN